MRVSSIRWASSDCRACSPRTSPAIFVTFAAALVLGTHGAVGKMLALPEFVAVVALARLAGAELTRRQMPTLTLLLAAKTLCLLAFLMLGVAFGPSPIVMYRRRCWPVLPALPPWRCRMPSSACILASVPPTTIMTNNTTQAVLDAVDLLRAWRHPRCAVASERIFRSIAASPSAAQRRRCSTI